MTDRLQLETLSDELRLFVFINEYTAFWRRTLHLNTKIQSYSPLCKTTVLLSKLKKGRERGRRGSATQRIYPSDSCPLVWFLFFFIIICIFLFVNSPCEQRQGLAVLSSTTPWLSSKNRANHHDGHTKKKKKKKKIKP